MFSFLALPGHICEQVILAFEMIKEVMVWIERSAASLSFSCSSMKQSPKDRDLFEVLWECLSPSLGWQSPAILWDSSPTLQHVCMLLGHLTHCLITVYQGQFKWYHQKGEPVGCLLKHKTIKFLESHFVADIGHHLTWGKTVNSCCCPHRVKATFF